MARALLVGLLLLFALPAAAQKAEEPEPTVRYQKVTTIEVEELEVDGTRQGPSGTRVIARGKVPFKSLIVVRRHFRPEMMRSAAEL